VQLPIFVGAEWLDSRRSDYIVVHAGYGSKIPEHVVPGAIYLNTDEIEYDSYGDSSQGFRAKVAKEIEEEPPRNYWRLYPDAQLLRALAFVGIGTDSKVVVYSEGPLAASRVAWALLKTGVSDVRVLDGGLDAWRNASFPVASAPSPNKPLEDGFGSRASLRPWLSAGIPQVRQLVSQGVDGSVADVRTRCEFEGECAPYPYIPTAGRVLNAVWAEGGTSDPYHMEGYLRPNNKLRPLDEIAWMWKRNDVCQKEAETCVFYCGTGWRSALATLVALELGREDVANFDGGWYLYSMGPGALFNPTIPKDKRLLRSLT